MSIDILIQRSHLNYTGAGSNKDYRTVLIQNNKTNRAIIIFRWGKAGAWGQMKVERFDRVSEAVAAVRTKISEKQNKGYRHVGIGTTVNNLDSEDQFKHVLGPQYWAQIGADNLKFICPEVDATGSRERPNPDWELGADGKWHAKPPPTRMVPDPVEPEPTAEEQVQRNPMWGMF